MACREQSFRDRAAVLGAGTKVDYLEQFGTFTFKEAALSKQLLYLKFDPSLKGSPNKLVFVATETRDAIILSLEFLELLLLLWRGCPWCPEARAPSAGRMCCSIAWGAWALQCKLCKEPGIENLE